VEKVDPHRAAVLDDVDKKPPRDAPALAEDVLRLSVVAAVVVAETFHFSPCSFGEIEAHHSDGNVDCRFCGEARDGRASHMFRCNYRRESFRNLSNLGFV
jgi:hypothetical protein